MAVTQFAPYAGFVSDIKKTYSKEYLKAQHAIGVNVRDYKEWDKTDLINLYDSYFGKVIFNHLAYLIGEARREEATYGDSPNRKAFTFAQNDLNEIAPHGLDWKGYDALMTEAIAEIKAHSFRITNDLLKLFEQYPVSEFSTQRASAELETSH